MTEIERHTTRRELVYSGAGGGVLRLLYREFADDMARPAFTQEVTYDLAPTGADTVASFKGVRLRVRDAGNAGLRYVVEEPFSAP